MAFKPLNTSDDSTTYRKTLLLAAAGWGKTTQAKHYKEAFGKGFIISGEAGLSSIRSAGIDYLPFTSFDGKVDEAKGVYSFTSICRMIISPEFQAEGYKWIMLDSLTELSDMVLTWADAKAIADAAAAGKKVNGFDKWGEYKDKMIGACKFIRDLPYHVIITSLVKESEDMNGDSVRLPLLQGSAVQSQIPGIFDNVLCGTATGERNTDGTVTTRRFIVSSAYKGWNGKVRDEHGVIKPVEETGNVCDLLKRLDA
jgi:hypothetical protein